MQKKFGWGVINYRKKARGLGVPPPPRFASRAIVRVFKRERGCGFGCN